MNGIAQLSIEEILLRVVLSVGIGAVFGVERGKKNRPAGARTYIFVCLGSCLVMLTNENLTFLYQTGDPARLGAQVISGIGFLGAGTILVTRDNQVRGLTTAAGLWLVACIGLSIGTGFYAGGLSVAAAMYISLIFGKRLNEVVQGHSRYLHLYISFSSATAMTTFLHKSQDIGMKMEDMQIIKGKKDERHVVAAMMTIRTPRGINKKNWMKELSNEEGVVFAEEII